MIDIWWRTFSKSDKLLNDEVTPSNAESGLPLYLRVDK